VRPVRGGGLRVRGAASASPRAPQAQLGRSLSGGVIRDCSASLKGLGGIGIGAGAVSDSFAWTHGGYGIVSSGGAVISENAARGNQTYGIEVGGASVISASPVSQNGRRQHFRWASQSHRLA